MNKSTEMQIEEYEKQLMQAMLQSDVKALDELLASDLIFTNHLGQLMTKQDDIEAHKSGIVKIDEMTLSDHKIKIENGVAIVSVQAHIVGSFAGVVSENNFRFTRVWSKTANEKWHVIAAHSSMIA